MSFATKMLSDEKGQPSCQRVCMLLLVVTVIVWVSMAGWKLQALPVIPPTLSDFVEWLLTALVFGVTASKGATAYEKGKAADNGCGTTTTGS